MGGRSNGGDYTMGYGVYVYRFSLAVSAQNASRITREFAMVGTALQGGAVSSFAPRRLPTKIEWKRKLRNNLKRGYECANEKRSLRRAQYRPFFGQQCNVDHVPPRHRRQKDCIFPVGDRRYCAICVSGIGSTKPLSAPVADRMYREPDFHCRAFAQCFPCWRYELQGYDHLAYLTADQNLIRVDHTPDTALRRFCVQCSASTITKDDIVGYVYGVLHSMHSRQRFANAVAEGLALIGFAPRIRASAEAVSPQLHLQYEKSEFLEHPSEAVSSMGQSRCQDEYCSRRASLAPCRKGAARHLHCRRPSTNRRLTVRDSPPRQRSPTAGVADILLLEGRRLAERHREQCHRLVHRRPRPSHCRPPDPPSQRRDCEVCGHTPGSVRQLPAA